MFAVSGGKNTANPATLRSLPDLHFHDLRHVAITRVAQKLPNVIELSAVTGHKSLAMLKRYYHVKPEVFCILNVIVYWEIPLTILRWMGMSKPNKTIERPLRSMLVPRNTYSMSIEEFIKRLADFLVASFEEEFLADVPPDDTRKIEFERHREFALETHRILTIKSLTKTLANRILAGDITFEHPVTKGRLFVKKFDKDGERCVFHGT